MLAPWKRGGRSVVMPVATAAAGRLRSAVLATALVGSAALAQVGCDSAAAKADAALRAAADKAHAKPATSAKDAPVAQAVEKSLGAAPPPTVTDALAALGAYDTAQPGTAVDWAEKARALTVRQKDAIARAMRAASIEDRRAVIAALEEATKTAGTTPEAQVDPLVRLATAEAAAADAIAREAGDREIESARMAADALRLLAQVRVNTGRVAYYKTLDPKATVDAMAAIRGKIAGSDATSVWAGEGDGSMPAGTAIDATAAKAQADLDKLAAEQKDATAKAAKLREEAGQASEESKRKAGELAYNLSVEAAKKTQEAAGVDVEIQGLDGQIVAARHQQQIAAARKPVVDEALKAFDIRRQQAEDRWKAVQDLAAQVTAESRRVVTGGDGAAGGGAKPPVGSPLDATLTAPGATRPANKPYTADDLARVTKDNFVVAKAARSAAAAAEADELRKQASDLYQSAVARVGKARDAAGAASRELTALKTSAGPQAAELPALDGRLEMLDESQFAYQEAEIRNRFARLLADKAIGVAVRADLRAEATKALEAAEITPAPEAIAGLPQRKDVDAEVKAADEAFAAAEAALDPFFKADGGGEQGRLYAEGAKTARGQATRDASVLLVNGLYARSRVLALGGDKSADAKLAAAVSAAQRYKQQYEVTAPPPFTPDVLTKIGFAPTTLPSARPTSAPASAPATAPASAPAAMLAPM